MVCAIISLQKNMFKYGQKQILKSQQDADDFRKKCSDKQEDQETSVL